MMRRIGVAAAALMLALSAGGQAAAARLALVIANPTDDGTSSGAQAVAAALGTAGYRVFDYSDVDAPHMAEAIRRFADTAGSATDGDNVLVFYYSGKALQQGSENYLVAGAGADGNAALVPLADYFQATRTTAHAANVVVLDAVAAGASAAGAGGLAAVDLRAEPDTLFLMPADPGETPAPASSSALGTAMAGELASADGSIEATIWQVTQRVAEASDYAQVPWSASSLSSDIAFRAPATAEAAMAARLEATAIASAILSDGAARGAVMGGIRLEPEAGAAAGEAAPAEPAWLPETESEAPPPPAMAPPSPPARSAAAPNQHQDSAASTAAPAPRGEDHGTDLETWWAAADIDTVDAYRGYLTAYPQGRCVKLAERRIGQIQRNIVLVSLQKGGSAAEALRRTAD